jgi:hypothetical protein
MFRPFSHVISVEQPSTLSILLTKNALMVDRQFTGEISIVSCGGFVEEKDLRQFGATNRLKVIDQRAKRPNREIQATIDNTIILETISFIFPNAKLVVFFCNNTHDELKKSLREAIKRNSNFIICSWSADRSKTFHLNVNEGQRLLVPYDFPINSHRAIKCFLTSDQSFFRPQEKDSVIDVQPVEFQVLNQKITVAGLSIGIALSAAKKFTLRELEIDGPDVVIAGHRANYALEGASWKVASDSDIATINENGELSAFNAGTCVVVALLDSGEKTKTVRVLGERLLNPTWVELNESRPLIENWISSDMTIINIHKKQMRAMRCGDATLTLDKERELLRWPIKVRVRPEQINIALKLYVGESCRLTVEDESASWKVDNNAIASIENGLLQTHEEGYVKVNVVNGFGQRSSFQVFVEELPKNHQL